MLTWATLKDAGKQFAEDQLTDRAAALTYYGILALFPGLIVLVALLGLVGHYPQTTNALLEIVDKVSPGTTADTFREPLDEMVKAKGGAGALFGIGLVVAIWSASGYIGAFMRALNAVYGVKERRPFWKLRPLQILLTLAMVLALTLVLVALVITGPLAKAVGDAVGLGDTAVEVWNIAKWPALVLVVMVTFALLYHTAPNVRPRKFRLVTWGSVIAVLAWLGASAGFTFYVANFGHYSTTYGSLGAVIVFLIWLWISNLALLLGAEIDVVRQQQPVVAETEPALRSSAASSP